MIWTCRNCNGQKFRHKFWHNLFFKRTELQTKNTGIRRLRGGRVRQGTDREVERERHTDRERERQTQMQREGDRQRERDLDWTTIQKVWKLRLDSNSGLVLVKVKSVPLRNVLDTALRQSGQEAGESPWTPFFVLLASGAFQRSAHCADPQSS